jgi:hypothetical protein
MNVKIPVKLKEWIKQIYLEGPNKIEYRDLLVAIRTQAIRNGYSNIQINETMHRAAKELNDQLRDERITKEYNKISVN